MKKLFFSAFAAALASFVSFEACFAVNTAEAARGSRTDEWTLGEERGEWMLEEETEKWSLGKKLASVWMGFSQGPYSDGTHIYTYEKDRGRGAGFKRVDAPELKDVEDIIALRFSIFGCRLNKNTYCIIDQGTGKLIRFDGSKMEEVGEPIPGYRSDTEPPFGYGGDDLAIFSTYKRAEHIPICFDGRNVYVAYCGKILTSGGQKWMEIGNLTAGIHINNIFYYGKHVYAVVCEGPNKIIKSLDLATGAWANISPRLNGNYRIFSDTKGNIYVTDDGEHLKRFNGAAAIWTDIYVDTGRHIHNAHNNNHVQYICNNGSLYAYYTHVDGVDPILSIFKCVQPPAAVEGTFSEEGAVYEGYMRNGVSHGLGKQTCSDGSVLMGNFRYCQLNGLGEARYYNGITYKGMFKNNEAHGKGVMRYPDGSVYQGMFKNNKKCGHGIFRYHDGRSYEGEFRDDLPNGK